MEITKVERYIPVNETIRVVTRLLQNDPAMAEIVAEQIKKIKSPIYRCSQCRWAEKRRFDLAPEADARYCTLFQKHLEENFFCGYGCPKPKKVKSSG